MPAARKRRHGKPHKALHVATYDRLEAYLRSFAAGHFHLLILVGSGGLAKSRSVRAVLGGKGCWIEGNATPLGARLGTGKIARQGLAAQHPAELPISQKSGKAK
jgi:hypothetical protein